MTLVVHGKFECANADLGKFLQASALLPNMLQNGTNPLAKIQAFKLPWWQPTSLLDVSGVECDWEAGSDFASYTLTAGQSAQGGRTTVYFMVVYENKKQTGLRSNIKADPNW